MKALLCLFTASFLLAGFSGCATADSDAGPQPTRPQGSGGRGHSPGAHAETSSATGQAMRN